MLVFMSPDVIPGMETWAGAYGKLLQQVVTKVMNGRCLLGLEGRNLLLASAQQQAFFYADMKQLSLLLFIN